MRSRPIALALGFTATLLVCAAQPLRAQERDASNAATHRRVATGAGLRAVAQRRIYGAQFWLYGGMDGLAADAHSPAGGQGQWAVIVPSHNAVIVRRGFDAGGAFKIAKFSADVLAAIQ